MTAQLVQFRPAMQIALAQIEDAFSEAGEIDSFKTRVRDAIKYGTGYPAVRARYSGRLRVLYDASYSLDAAIIVVDRWYDAERAIMKLMATIPYAPQPAGLSLQIIRELRLLLRMLRADGRGIFGAVPKPTRFGGHYKAIIALVIQGYYCTAAEA